MTVTVPASATGQGGGTATTVVWPTVQDGDVAVLWVFGDDQDAISISGTYPLATAVNQTTGSSRRRAYGVFYRICTGAETGDISVDRAAAEETCAVLFVFRGVDTGTVAARLAAGTHAFVEDLAEQVVPGASGDPGAVVFKAAGTVVDGIASPVTDGFDANVDGDAFITETGGPGSGTCAAVAGYDVLAGTSTGASTMNMTGGWSAADDGAYFVAVLDAIRLRRSALVY